MQIVLQLLKILQSLERLRQNYSPILFSHPCPAVNVC